MKQIDFSKKQIRIIEAATLRVDQHGIQEDEEHSLKTNQRLFYDWFLIGYSIRSRDEFQCRGIMKQRGKKVLKFIIDSIKK